MRIWIVLYHHRYGAVDAWPVVSEVEPDLEEFENGIDNFESEREHLELVGAFEV